LFGLDYFSGLPGWFSKLPADWQISFGRYSSAAKLVCARQTKNAAKAAAIFMFAPQGEFAMLCEIDCIKAALFLNNPRATPKNQAYAQPPGKIKNAA